MVCFYKSGGEKVREAERQRRCAALLTEAFECVGGDRLETASITLNAANRSVTFVYFALFSALYCQDHPEVRVSIHEQLLISSGVVPPAYVYMS